MPDEPWSSAGRPDSAKAEEIRSEFLHAWGGYRRHAWGHDELLPLSGGHREFFSDRHPVGLSIIEALDTHHVMGLDQEVARCLDWIDSGLRFDVDAEFHVFEAVIRLVGGLLSGYLATGEHRLLSLCTELADRLLPAFAKSPTGLPYRRVNLRTGAVSGDTVPLAEAGTSILEFGTLSQLTGNPDYFDASKKALRAVVRRRSPLGLLGTRLHVETGRWADHHAIALDPPADSFYEYLWGGWEMFADRECLDWFHTLTDALFEHQAERVAGRLWFRQVDARTGTPLGRRKQSELAACALPARGAATWAADYHQSWTAVMDRYEVIPEAIDYARLQPIKPVNKLRPEYANAAFELYRVTADPFYRTTAWRYFCHLKRHHRVPAGYATVTDITRRPMPHGDHCPAYVFAENFKWLYLTFSATERFDYAGGYLSTEGKILRGLHTR